MPRVKKLILVTAEHHPTHRLFKQVAAELGRELGVEVEERIEDYVFLIQHGETDEFGMAWVPQLLAELDTGEVKPVLTKMPFNERLKSDPELGRREALERIRQLTGG